MNSNFSLADASDEIRAAPGVDLPSDGVGIGGAAGASGNITGNMDNFHINDLLLTGGLATATSTQMVIAANAAMMTLSGTGFTYDASAHINGGLLQTFDYTGPDGPGVTGHISLGFSPLASGITSQVIQWITDGSTTTMFTALLQGDDNLGGGPGADLLRGFGGNDVIQGNGGDGDALFGGTGNDTLVAGNFSTTNDLPAGSSYLRGEDGDDSIQGAAGFDDINGNMGNDTAHGNGGDDWVVGGKDNDMLFGDAGNDIVWGNLGNDTLDGGNGNDQVRGGQGDDVVNGGPGNDFVSGDRGNDTVTGGPGADIFHGSQDAGIDRVLDFSLAEGDKVMLDPGTTFTVSQVGADTVIDMGNGNQMILQSVQLSTLPPGTIFLG